MNVKVKARKILIFESSNIISTGIVNQFLDQQFELYHTKSNYKALFSDLNNHSPDILITYSYAYGIIEDSIIDTIRKYHKDLKIVLILSSQDKERIIKAISSGVSGVIPVNSTHEDFIDGINKILDGELYFNINDDKANFLLLKNFLHNSINTNLNDFKVREEQVLDLISKGMSSKDIAKELKLSKRTIDVYRCNLMQKFNCSTSIELVKYSVYFNLYKNIFSRN